VILQTEELLTQGNNKRGMNAAKRGIGGGIYFAITIFVARK
jgi:hypothetical protein